MTPTFGQVIRTARINIGYSQRELAALVEIDFTYLSKLESDSTEYPRVCSSATSALPGLRPGGTNVPNGSLTRTLPRFSQAKL